MSENGKTTILDGGVSAGLAQWIQAQRQRGKEDKAIIIYMAKIWLDFAWSKVPKGDKAKIRENLMQIVTKSVRIRPGRKNRVSGAQSEYQGTLAERIVRALNYRNARGLKGAAFFRVVGRFVNARQFSAKHHAAGFYPAYRFIKKASGDSSGPRYSKHPPGSAEGKFLDGLAELIMENFASAHAVPGRPSPLGIAGLAGEAFESSAPEVAEMFARFVREDSIKQGMAAGFSVVSFG